jgi:hypothetical protein
MFEVPPPDPSLTKVDGDDLAANTDFFGAAGFLSAVE